MKIANVVEGFLIHPILWGVVALLAFSIALSGRLSVPAAQVVLWIAYGAAIFGVFRALRIDMPYKIFITLAVAGVLGVGAVFLQRWYKSKAEGINPLATEQDTFKRPVTLKEMFEGDWSNMWGYYTVGTVKDPSLSRSVPIEWRLNGDFFSHSRFLVYYIDWQVSPREAMPALMVIANDYQQCLRDADAAVDIIGQSAGDSAPTHFKDMVFSNRIFVYYGNPDFSLTDKGFLEAFYKQKGLSIQFRDSEYEFLNRNDQSKLRNEPLVPNSVLAGHPDPRVRIWVQNMSPASQLAHTGIQEGNSPTPQ